MCRAIGKNSAAFWRKVEQWISDNVYFTDDQGMTRQMVDGYGIGISYSREITDLEFAARERHMQYLARSRGIKLPTVYLRQVDDIFLVFEGTWEQFMELKSLVNTMDTNRKLEWDISIQSVNWKDLTI